MPSHQAVLDVPMHGNAWLINEVLRGEFGAGNISTVSDCNDIGAMQFFRIAPNMSRVVGYAMKAGVDADLQCGPSGGSVPSYFSSIPDALADGYASRSDLEALAGHVLTQKFAAGLFDAPLVPEEWAARLNAPEHRQLAYEAAAQSIVLLQNGQAPGGQGQAVLPLAALQKSSPKLALLGPHMLCSIPAVAGTGSSAGSSAAPAGCAARDAMLGS
jgi:beta-glucosidase